MLGASTWSSQLFLSDCLFVYFGRNPDPPKKIDVPFLSPPSLTALCYFLLVIFYFVHNCIGFDFVFF